MLAAVGVVAVVAVVYTYGISAAESHAAVSEDHQTHSATKNPPSHSPEPYTALMRWLSDFEIRQERKLHTVYEEIAELRADIAGLHTGLEAYYSQMDSRGKSQLYAPSAESMIERGVMAGWSQT